MMMSNNKIIMAAGFASSVAASCSWGNRDFTAGDYCFTTDTSNAWYSDDPDYRAGQNNWCNQQYCRDQVAAFCEPCNGTIITPTAPSCNDGEILEGGSCRACRIDDVSPTASFVSGCSSFSSSASFDACSCEDFVCPNDTSQYNYFQATEDAFDHFLSDNTPVPTEEGLIYLTTGPHKGQVISAGYYGGGLLGNGWNTLQGQFSIVSGCLQLRFTACSDVGSCTHPCDPGRCYDSDADECIPLPPNNIANNHNVCEEDCSACDTTVDGIGLLSDAHFTTGLLLCDKLESLCQGCTRGNAPNDCANFEAIAAVDAAFIEVQETCEDVLDCPTRDCLLDAFEFQQDIAGAYYNDQHDEFITNLKQAARDCANN